MNFPQIIFTTPAFQSEHSAWHEHTPFAFFLIERLKPDMFVELGSYSGESYFAFCQAIKMLGIPAWAYAVDTFSGDVHAGFYSREAFNHLKKINDEHFSHFSNLINSSFDEACDLFEDGSIDLLHIDGLHTYEAVKHDYEHWLPKMSSRGVIIFHDTAVTTGGFGVWRLLDELRGTLPLFEFQHGYGLGVLCTGKDVPGDFLEFMLLAGKDPFIPGLFHHLGRKNMLDLQVKILREKTNQLQLATEDKTESLQRSEFENSLLKKDVATMDHQIQLLQETIVRLTADVNDLEEELSEKTAESDRSIAELKDQNGLLQQANQQGLKQIDELQKIRRKDNDLLVRLQHVHTTHVQQSEKLSKENAMLREELEFLKNQLMQITGSSAWRMIQQVQRARNLMVSRKRIKAAEMETIRNSGMFDPEFYIGRNGDVRTAELDPVHHYLEYGGFEGRDPSAGFDSAFYLHQYPDVAASGINPLLHYLTYGRIEGRKPKAEPELKSQSVIKHSPAVMPQTEPAPALKVPAEDPVVSARELIMKSGFFSAKYYLENNPDLLRSNVDPLDHFIRHGWRENRCPGPEFDTAFYLTRHPDVKASGMNPLIHYIKYGQKEGRQINNQMEMQHALVKAPRVMLVSGESRTPGHFYRVENLLDSLNRLGISAAWTTPELLASQPSVLDHTRLLVFWRAAYSTDTQDIINHARKCGCLVVFDIDDLMFDPAMAVPEQMDAIRSLKRSQSEIQGYCSRMQTTAVLSDLCLGTTAEIAEGFRRLGKKCFVLPNGYSRKTFEESVLLRRNRSQSPGLVRIGYAGGTLTHQRDFSIALPALIRILHEFPQTRLTLFSEVLNLREFPELEAFADRIELRSLVPYPDLQKEIVRFDINIAPLDNTDFCNAKSELKFFEAALLGIPTIASPTPPFRRAIKHEVSGFLADSTREWYEYLRRLVTDEALRKTIGRNAFTYVRWHFSPEERSLLVSRFLTMLTEDFLLQKDLMGNRHYFIGSVKNEGIPIPSMMSHASFHRGKAIHSQIFTGKSSRIGLLVWLYGERDHADLLLDSLTRQTFQGIDLMLCAEQMNPDFEELLTSWQTLNSQHFNRIIIALPEPGCNLTEWLNFATEELTNEFVAVVEEGSWLLPDTISRFVEMMEVSGAACGEGPPSGDSLPFAMFRSAFIIREGGFPAIAASLQEATGNMSETIRQAGHPVVTIPGMALLPVVEPALAGLQRSGSADQQLTILFIGHDDAMAGAEVLLLNVIQWMKDHLPWRLKLLLIEQKGVLISEYEKICEVILYEKYRRGISNPALRRCALAGRIGHVDLVYGNTVLSATVAEELSFLHSPVVFHIHEMESVIRTLLNDAEIRILGTIPGHFISCSGTVTQNLSSAHRIEPEKISTIEAFIHPPLKDSLADKQILRQKYGWATDAFIVLGCGAVNYRKGVDLFITTAISLHKAGFTNFRFIWLGEMVWDSESYRWNAPPWSKYLSEISLAGLDGQITFSGPVSNIYDYLPAADLFYLPSREDPFPLVVLEASMACIPTLCFRGSGGIPEAFGEEAIMTVAMENVEEAARTIIQLAGRPEQLTNYAQKAHQIVKERFVTEAAMPRIADLCKGLMEGKKSGSTSEDVSGNNSKPCRWLFVTTNDGSPDGGSEKLWIQSAIRCREQGDEVAIVIKQWDPEPTFIESFFIKGIRVFLKNQNPFENAFKFHPDLAVISIGDQDEGAEWFDFLRISVIPYVIVNHLTKEPAVCPVVERLIPGLQRGYMGASKVLFTGQNNLSLMERRLGCKIPSSGIFFNPTDVERFPEIPFPGTEDGWQLAMVGTLLNIHKGQRLAFELMSQSKWKERPVTLNLYGKGPDEKDFRLMAQGYGLSKVVFHGHVSDIHGIWQVNHALLMPSFMEGLPLALTAAMMCGRVPVVTNVGAHTEVIADNITGFIAGTPSLADLDEALERAWNRRYEWEAIGLRAREFIHQYIPEDPIGVFIRNLRNHHQIKNPLR